MCLFNLLEQKYIFVFFLFFFLCNLSRADATSLQGCSTSVVLSCFAKQTDERAWQRSALLGSETLNTSGRAETPTLPWTNRRRRWHFPVKTNRRGGSFIKQEHKIMSKLPGNPWDHGRELCWVLEQRKLPQRCFWRRSNHWDRSFWERDHRTGAVVWVRAWNNFNGNFGTIDVQEMKCSCWRLAAGLHAWGVKRWKQVINYASCNLLFKQFLLASTGTRSWMSYLLQTVTQEGSFCLLRMQMRYLLFGLV